MNMNPMAFAILYALAHSAAADTCPNYSGTFANDYRDHSGDIGSVIFGTPRRETLTFYGQTLDFVDERTDGQSDDKYSKGTEKFDPNADEYRFNYTSKDGTRVDFKDWCWNNSFVQTLRYYDSKSYSFQFVHSVFTLGTDGNILRQDYENGDNAVNGTPSKQRVYKKK
jgi:hypothetical protein